MAYFDQIDGVFYTTNIALFWFIFSAGLVIVHESSTKKKWKNADIYSPLICFFFVSYIIEQTYLITCLINSLLYWLYRIEIVWLNESLII